MRALLEVLSVLTVLLDLLSRVLGWLCSALEAPGRIVNHALRDLEQQEMRKRWADQQLGAMAASQHLGQGPTNNEGGPLN